MTSEVALEHKNDVVAEKAVEFPRGQRPGLGRKRPRFSLLPNISQPTVNLEPTLDFDKLKGPEEFFLAYERLENAKKEIAKQTGHVFTDSDQYNVFMVPRSQRLGIPGRSSMAKYKHLYPTMLSQETSEEDILSSCGPQQEHACPNVASHQTEPANAASQQLEPTNDASQQTESASVASEEMELDDSEVEAENSVNKFLDEFLLHHYEELEGDGAINLLQDRLQIKPLHIEKLSLPELPDIQRINFKASGVNLPKHRNVLSDIHNLLNGAKNITPMKLQNAESSVPSFGSPTPPKNPLASLSLLRKVIFQPNLSSDPFSTVDIGQPSARNASPVEDINKDSDPIDVEKTLCISFELNSLTTEEDDGTIVDRSSTMAVGDFTCSFEKCLNERSLRLASGNGVGLRESGLELEDNNVCMDYDVINENLSQADAVVNRQANGPDELEDIVEDVMREAVASVPSDQKTDDCPVEMSNSIQNKHGQSNLAVGKKRALDGCADIQDGAPEQIQETISEQQNEKFQEPSAVSIQKQRKTKVHPHKGRYNTAQSRRQGLADQAMDGCDKCQDSTSDQIHDTTQEQTQATSPERHNEQIQESSVISMNERIKAKPNPRKERKSKVLSGRQSLAGCGMSWETGVRRSTRIRSRPLEYWKGERFLYGRIHQSLATIIGIKYESPQKDKEKPTMKVKSFVSDEYKDLVEQAALY
ncbi:centromere protein C isoform X1 [Hevea brasiliensis]|uniref:centromere protein C isoform X1 n=1 Tax=Hevea brasiliensis TaxID=3981 RepID=UPI0025FFE5E6|nr:centromere protein C isoform X1 [Hevea brasiliensis]XP_021665320.2 centromere protein C isoform X1 [Hevea brasiliensis]